MDSSQVFLAKSILRALIHDIDLENPFYGVKAFTRFMWEKLAAGLVNYAARLLARQQFLWRIQRREEETTRLGSAMRIYNPLSKQQEDEIDRRFGETVDALEIVQVDNHAIVRIIFGVDSGYSPE